MQRAITENNANKDSSVIVGDTKFDLIGGKTVGIKTIAVIPGFGTNETLLAENPDFVAETTQEPLGYFEIITLHLKKSTII